MTSINTKSKIISYRRFIFSLCISIFASILLLTQVWANAIPARGVVMNNSVISSFVGSTTQGNANGSGVNATFRLPMSIAFDSQDNMYVADYLNHLIRKVTPEGIVTTFAGSGFVGNADGLGTSASFNMPRSLAIDANDNVYVSEIAGAKIRKITPDGQVTTVAGNGQSGFQNATGSAAQFNFPNGIAVDTNGNVFVADSANHRIRKITPDGEVTTYAGNGTGITKNGSLAQATFQYPMDLTFDTNGNLFVLEGGGNVVRKITPAGSVTTIAGSGASGAIDHYRMNASFQTPAGIAVDSSGNIYIADTYNHRIRRITLNGLVSTIAGNTAGSANGKGTNARFNTPSDVALNSQGQLFIADTLNNQIRKLSLNTQLNLLVSQTHKLYAKVLPIDATNRNVTWTSSNPLIASVDQTGLVSGIGNGSATITATSEDGNYKTSTRFTVTTSVTSVQFTQSTLELAKSQSIQLVMTISPETASNKLVTWKSSNNQVVQVDATGKITALKSGQATITVTTKDKGKKASCLVTVP